MTRSTRTSLAGALGAVLVLAIGCVSDGAVRLARCVERAAERLDASPESETRELCDLRLDAPSLVLVFPEEVISSRRLEAEGLTLEEMRTVDLLQLGDAPYSRINVLPSSRRPRPSRTSYHRHLVAVPNLLVCRSEDSRVELTLRRSADGLALAAVE